MATQQQINANNQNSKLSTGPKTPEGKATVSNNSLKFGLRSKSILLPHENESEWLLLKEGFISDFSPVGHFELFLVESLAALAWRKMRLIQAESQIFQYRKSQIEAQNEEPTFGFGELKLGSDHVIGTAFALDMISNLARYETSLDRALSRTLNELRQTQLLRLQRTSEQLALSNGELG